MRLLKKKNNKTEQTGCARLVLNEIFAKTAQNKNEENQYVNFIYSYFKFKYRSSNERHGKSNLAFVTLRNSVFSSFFSSSLLSQRVKQVEKKKYKNKKKRKRQLIWIPWRGDDKRNCNDSNQKYLNDGIFIRRNENTYRRTEGMTTECECRSFSNFKQNSKLDCCRRDWWKDGILPFYMAFDMKERRQPIQIKRVSKVFLSNHARK